MLVLYLEQKLPEDSRVHHQCFKCVQLICMLGHGYETTRKGYTGYRAQSGVTVPPLNACTVALYPCSILHLLPI